MTAEEQATLTGWARRTTTAQALAVRARITRTNPVLDDQGPLVNRYHGWLGWCPARGQTVQRRNGGVCLDTSQDVLLVAENGHSGGIGRYCVDLAGALDDRAGLVCLCPAPCSGADGCWLSAQCANRGIPLHRVAMPARGWRAGFTGLVDLWKQSRRPVIHVNGRRGNAIASAARRLVPGFRYVTTVHGVLGLHARRNAVYRFVDLAACRGAEVVIAVSTDTRDQLVRFGSPTARTVTITNGLAAGDLDALRRVADGRPDAQTPREPLRIGFLGRLSPEKGTRDLCAAARWLHDSPAVAHVAIAGDGPDREWLMAELRPLLDSGFVRYRGVVDTATGFLSEVDVVVMPSRNEGTPYVLLEAMAAGCAVVAYRVGGIPEVIADPTLGILVPPGDAEGFLVTLDRLCTTPSAVAEIGGAASQHVREHYALAGRLRMISQVYGTALAAAGRTVGRQLDGREN